VSAPPRHATPCRAAAAGTVSGMRTFIVPGVLAGRGRWGEGWVSRVLPLAAAGELVADKLPAMPPRSDPPGLAGRIASATASGAALGGLRAAAVAAACAAVSTPVSQRLRATLGRRTGLPDAVLGLAEDALALGGAVWVTRPVRAR
jgi:uncharacterized membrane protein